MAPKCWKRTTGHAALPHSTGLQARWHAAASMHAAGRAAGAGQHKQATREDIVPVPGNSSCGCTGRVATSQPFPERASSSLTPVCGPSLMLSCMGTICKGRTQAKPKGLPGAELAGQLKPRAAAAAAVPGSHPPLHRSSAEPPCHISLHGHLFDSLPRHSLAASAASWACRVLVSARGCPQASRLALLPMH